ncbi:aromatic amino acid transport family protein [Candidatus Fukatsuia anoeciicola]|uniref:aromatic amino acid transport family protein n=1 Tax=Candidatus Fukatsuia anoeciicola TaxID=2994492 RepID=UPI00346406E9
MLIMLPSSSLQPSVFSGVIIVISTTIGIGMFSIPIITSGIWFSGSILLLIYTWVCMFISGLMILEVNLNYPISTSFHTMVKDLLGNTWSLINGLSITFVLYILMYAYISTSGSIITSMFSKLVSINYTEVSFIFALIIAFIILLPTCTVNYLSRILIIGMLISFILSISHMFINIKIRILLNQSNHSASYLPYALATLPYLLTSFGYHGNIPRLVKYYRKNSQAVVFSLFYGTLIALIIYILWQCVIQGNIARETFKQIILEGGNISSLLKRIDIVSSSIVTKQLLNTFSYMALASSFLGVSLGLFDYIADFFKLANYGMGKVKIILLTFVPPTLGALLFPNGFLYAIGFAGLAATIWAVIVPALMVYVSRHRFPLISYKVPGGKIIISFIIIFGVANVTIYIATSLSLLPIYK